MIHTNDLNLDLDRINSFNALEQAGVDMFPGRYPRSHRIGEVTSLFEGTRVSLAGRIYQISQLEKYIMLGDSSGQVKVIFGDGLSEKQLTIFNHIQRGDLVGIEGNVDTTCQVHAFSLTLLSKALNSLPEPEEWGCDNIQRGHQRYLDLILRPEARNIFELRPKYIKNVREFLSGFGYLEVETPVLVPVADLAEVEQFSTFDRDNQALFMRLCHEDRVKRLLIGGFDKLFELGKSFRKEQVSWKHSPEFLQLECLEAYADYEEMMDLAQNLISISVIKTIHADTINFQGKSIDLSKPWRKITVRDAIQEYAGIDIGNTDSIEPLSNIMQSRGCDLPDGYYEWYNLVALLIDKYVEPHLVQPTFLVDYPAYSNYYAKRKPENTDLIERFELYIAGIEISNGYSLVIDPIDFRKRLDHSIYEYHQRGKTAPSRDDDLVLAKTFGMPPCSVVGFGMERILMLLTNQESIHDVIWFPSHAQ